ncbi:Uncharacterised protein [Vibrio cholerae]|nr:Uncharacterised protein [Vibrio cholerae]
MHHSSSWFTTHSVLQKRTRRANRLSLLIYTDDTMG